MADDDESVRRARYEAGRWRGGIGRMAKSPELRAAEAERDAAEAQVEFLRTIVQDCISLNGGIQDDHDRFFVRYRNWQERAQKALANMGPTSIRGTA